MQHSRWHRPWKFWASHLSAHPLSYCRKRPLYLEALENRTLMSITPHLLVDLNQVGQGSNPQQFVAAGNLTYFVATDVAHGTELWRTDGTTAGTRLVKDINPGSSGANPRALTEYQGKLFFFANDGVHGNEPWMTDGTAAGTHILKDIAPGLESSNSYTVTIASFKGKLFFNADDGAHGKELWQTDGTKAGTTMVADINSGASGSYPYSLTKFKGKLYFEAQDASHGAELWRSDGTAGGTSLVKDITVGTSGSFPHALTPTGDTLFFAASGGLWKTDGTPVGTTLVKNVQSAQFLTNVNGMLIFEGQFDLWKSDGTTAGTSLVTKINPTAIAQPFGIIAFGGKAYFSADDGTHGRELWTSDGTAAGTSLVKDINPGSGYGVGFDPDLTVFNQKLYFEANDGASGGELWTSDGTGAGTTRLLDINPGAGNGVVVSYPRSITAVRGKLFFAADNGHTGAEPWISGGRAANTRLLDDINLATQDSNPSQFTAFNGGVAFAANDGAHGSELWKTDGTATGTSLVNDILPGGGSSYPNLLTSFEGNLIFSAFDGVSQKLLQSDGTPGGTIPLANIFESSPATDFNGTLFLGASDSANGGELWKSDGTTSGTSLVKDIYPGTTYYPVYGTYINSSYPNNLTAFKGAIYFAASDENGRELWTSDGTETGTHQVIDLVPGTHYVYGAYKGNSSNPNNLTVMNGQLFFVATDVAHGRELWVSDGTAAGTHVVKDIVPGGGSDYYSDGNNSSNPTNLTVVGGKLFFFADDGVHGRELWESDGTEAGTSMVSDTNPGVAGSTPQFGASLVSAGGKVFFFADDGTHGKELWTSDGTTAGTKLTLDINPGAAASISSSPALTAVGGRVFFAADDGVHGRELWASDGTTAGTGLVMDIRPGSAGAFPDSGQVITNVNGALYFAANDGVHGNEPWVIPANQLAAPGLAAPLGSKGLNASTGPAIATRLAGTTAGATNSLPQDGQTLAAIDATFIARTTESLAQYEAWGPTPQNQALVDQSLMAVAPAKPPTAAVAPQRRAQVVSETLFAGLTNRESTLWDVLSAAMNG